MIRRIFTTRIALILLVFSLAATPVLAQNLWLTPKSKETETDSAPKKDKGSIFLAPKGDQSKSKVFKKKETVKREALVDLSKIKLPKNFNPDMLRQDGPPPKTAEDLYALGMAYSLPQIENMLEMKAKTEAASTVRLKAQYQSLAAFASSAKSQQNEAAAEVKTIKGDKKISSNAEPGKTETNAVARKKTIYNKPAATGDKPSRVFSDFR